MIEFFSFRETIKIVKLLRKLFRNWKQLKRKTNCERQKREKEEESLKL